MPKEDFPRVIFPGTQHEACIRRFSFDDVDTVVSVERSASKHPWTEQNFVSSIGAGHLCLALTQNGQFIGHAVVSVLPDELELLIISVAPDRQRKGYACALLVELCNIFDNRDFFLEVREGNLPAIALYKRLGFNVVDQRKAYYSTPEKQGLRENALVMRRLKHYEYLY